MRFLIIMVFMAFLVFKLNVHGYNKSMSLQFLYETAKNNTRITEPKDAVWQLVKGCKHEFYVYSAYAEHRGNKTIRVIAATRTYEIDSKFICLLRLPDNRLFPLQANVDVIREHHDFDYSAVFVQCLLDDTGVDPNEAVGGTVSVVSQNAAKKPPTNYVLILDIQPRPETERSLSVCVKPLHSQEEHIDWLIEWFELNQLLGVSHFYLYNKTMSKEMTCLIEHYRNDYGLITLLPWNLPITRIWAWGQAAAFNDCMYRSMSTTKYLMIIDLDEVVIPRYEHTLLQLINKFTAWYPLYKAPSSFLFRNAFFCASWKDDSAAPTTQLLTARKTFRAEPKGTKDRSKFIIRPSHVYELGNHFAHAHFGEQYDVAPEFGLLHHYRESCHESQTDELPVIAAMDREAQKHSIKLVQRVIMEKKIFKRLCPNLSLTVET